MMRPLVRREAISDLIGHACCWVVLALAAAVGLALLLPRPAPRPPRHSAVEQLFLAPKVGLRAAVGYRESAAEARRR